MRVEVTIWPGQPFEVDEAEVPELQMLGILVEPEKPAEEGKEQTHVRDGR